MSETDFSPQVLERLKKLQEKYNVMGQDLVSYLDGLLYSDFLTYWDYIHLDTLLSLQNPKTDIPDERIFIAYHQITELYFRLILWELEAIAQDIGNTPVLFLEKVSRINRYFQHLTHSFDIMVDGMSQQEFLKFRMALLPASGFQSVQYRLIEIGCTDFINLVDKDIRNTVLPTATLEEMYQNIYWKKGATEMATGKKTLTLVKFESKYSELILDTAHKYQFSNLRHIYKTLLKPGDLDKKIIAELRFLDVNVNVNWPLSHYKSAVRYLQRDPEDIAATGGTNWQKYLPPRFQRRVFFPELWNEPEMQNWGKGWVMREVFQQDKS
jgi:tryptophan 2,3-dioxygenase